MDTVIIVNLNGNAFHLEEPGYLALRTYLEGARAQLRDNPDCDEILTDLEQAIADKCLRFLLPHKNVIGSVEIEAVLREMGPVQADAAADAPSPDDGADSARRDGAADSGQGPRRLYQIREGAMVSGICMGLAVYFNLDVTLVRIVFVILTLLTGGLWLLVYGAMMMLVPFANTEQDRAAAGEPPLNAREVMDRARRHYAEFRDGRAWRAQWRQQRRAWRRQWHEGASGWRYNLQRNVQQPGSGGGYFAQVFMGLMIPMLAILSAVMFGLFAASVVTFATTGSLFGFNPFGGAPLWVSLLILCFGYTLIASPLHHMRRAVYLQRGAPPGGCFGPWDGLVTSAAFLFVFWLAYRHIPEVHAFVANFSGNVELVWHNIVDSFRQSTQHATDVGAASAAAASAAAAASSAD